MIFEQKVLITALAWVRNLYDGVAVNCTYLEEADFYRRRADWYSKNIVDAGIIMRLRQATECLELGAAGKITIPEHTSKNTMISR